MRIWDLSGNCLQTLEGHSGIVRSVAVSPYGSRIVSGSEDKTIKIWDATNGNCLYTLRGHTKRINTVDFSPDGSKVVSGSVITKLKSGILKLVCV